jgi:hypothetical protein
MMGNHHPRQVNGSIPKLRLMVQTSNKVRQTCYCAYLRQYIWKNFRTVILVAKISVRMKHDCALVTIILAMAIISLGADKDADAS